MSFLKNLFRHKLNGEALARSEKKQEYAQIELLSTFAESAPAHEALEQQRWNRVLSQSYMETLAALQKQGWLEATASGYQMTAEGKPYVLLYQERLDAEKASIMPKVRSALEARDAGKALEIRREYEEKQPLGKAAWTGPEPQLSHSALTRRILFLQHRLLEGLNPEVVDWLKLYAAEQHLWGTHWYLSVEDVPQIVQQALATSEMDGVEAVYWRAYQLALYVENQETWQRCNGGDHVRRIEIVGPNDEYTCKSCREILGKQYLVARVPELPHRECTSSRGCRCRYEPVLEMYEEL